MGSDSLPVGDSAVYCELCTIEVLAAGTQGHPSSCFSVTDHKWVQGGAQEWRLWLG